MFSYKKKVYLLTKFVMKLLLTKYKGKKNNIKDNDFLILDCPMKNSKENQVQLKLFCLHINKLKY